MAVQPSVSLGYSIFVGLLGRAIGPSEGFSLPVSVTAQHIYGLSGIRTHGPSIQAHEAIRDLYRVKQHYQPRANIIKDENCNLLADLSRVLNISLTRC